MLTIEAYPESYYVASAHETPERPPLAGDRSVDVAIVGAGFTGLSAALELAERGLSVAVLEARRVAWGASGRNGGQICTGYSSGMGALREQLGEADARLLFEASEEGKVMIRERIERHGIDCDLVWGYFVAAEKQRQLDELKRDRESYARRYGYDGTSIVEGRQAVAEHVGTTRYLGGLVDPGAGHLHPLNYCLGLARAAEAAGATIHEGTAVTGIEQGPKVRLTTPQGTVEAEHAILGANAYLENLVPGLRARIMPVGTYIAATEPLGENRAKALLPLNEAVSDCNFALDYYRLSADHRLLFGGRVSYSTFDPPSLEASLRRRMLRVFPDLGDAAIESAWGGYVAITQRRTPDIGRIGERLYYAQGFSGQGVVNAQLAGRVIAEAIAGQAGRLDVYARIRNRPFPGGPLLRTPTLVLAMLWARLRDAMP